MMTAMKSLIFLQAGIALLAASAMGAQIPREPSMEALHMVFCEGKTLPSPKPVRKRHGLLDAPGVPILPEEGINDSEWLLYESMRRFLHHKLLPLLRRAYFPEDSPPRPMGESVRKDFEEIMGIEPCHQEMIDISEHKVYEWLFKRDDLAAYFGVYEAMLSELREQGVISEIQQNRAVDEFKKYQTRLVESRRLESGAALDGAGAAKDGSVRWSSIVKCFGKRLKKDGLLAESETPYEILLYYALFHGNHRVRLSRYREPLESCPSKGDAKEFAVCVLGKLGYGEPARVAEIFEREEIVFLGYIAEDLDFFERQLKDYSALLALENNMHFLFAVLNPVSRNLLMGRWNRGIFAIELFGRAQIDEYVSSLGPGCGGKRRQALERDLLDHRRESFFHELAHAIGMRLLRLERSKVKPLGKDWMSLSWAPASGKDSSVFLPKKRPFRCEGVKPPPKKKVETCRLTAGAGAAYPTAVSRKYGFVSHYASVSPREDFAESFAAFITGKPVRLEAIHRGKYRFIKKLIEKKRPN